MYLHGTVFAIIISTWSFGGLAGALSTGLFTSIEPIYQFPNGTFVENSVMLPNGTLLVSQITMGPIITGFDTKRPQSVPKLAYRFPGREAVFGLAQPTPGLLAAVVGNITLGQPQTGRNWAIAVLALADGRPAVLRKTIPVPQGRNLNGMTALPTDPSRVLVADTTQGIVHRVNLCTGTAEAPLDDPLFKPTDPSFRDGVNGVHAPGNGCLYFTNSNRNILGRIAITPHGALNGSAAETVYTSPPESSNFDDFAIARNNMAYICGNADNEILEVKDGVVIATYQDPKLLNHPTSVQLGRGKLHNTLLVTTGGSQPGENSGGGRVTRILLDET